MSGEIVGLILYAITILIFVPLLNAYDSFRDEGKLKFGVKKPINRLLRKLRIKKWSLSQKY